METSDSFGLQPSFIHVKGTYLKGIVHSTHTRKVQFNLWLNVDKYDCSLV